MIAPSMQDFSTASLMELLRYVLERAGWDYRAAKSFVDTLCNFPAAARLSAESVSKLLQLVPVSLPGGFEQFLVAGLLKLPAA